MGKAFRSVLQTLLRNFSNSFEGFISPLFYQISKFDIILLQ